MRTPYHYGVRFALREYEKIVESRHFGGCRPNPVLRIRARMFLRNLNSFSLNSWLYLTPCSCLLCDVPIKRE